MNAKPQIVNEDDVYAIAVASGHELQAWSLRDRFSAIRQIKDRVMSAHLSSKLGHEHYVDERSPECEIGVEALLQLNQTMRHSHAYRALLDQSRENTLARIRDDRYLFRRLKQWSLGLKTWKEDWAKNLLRRIHRHQVTATRQAIKDLAPARIHKTKMSFYHREKRRAFSNGRRIYIISTGSFHGDISPVGPERKIKINLHPHTKWQQHPCKTAAVVHHETIHDQGFQLASEFHHNNRLTLGHLTQDARLWSALKLEEATICSRIRSPYRAQFHEVVAYEQQPLFREGLQNILHEGRDPVLKVA